MLQEQSNFMTKPENAWYSGCCLQRFVRPLVSHRICGPGTTARMNKRMNWNRLAPTHAHDKLGCLWRMQNPQPAQAMLMSNHKPRNAVSVVCLQRVENVIQ